MKNNLVISEASVIFSDALSKPVIEGCESSMVIRVFMYAGSV
jgi:hypothetical protein